MSEERFEKLREHLSVLQATVDGFCSLSGYVPVDPRSIGRYPRIRIERRDDFVRWFDLWMELDDDGQRYQSFFEDVPYELAAGAFVDVKDNTPYGHRYQKSFRVFSRRPFREIPEVLLGVLQENERELQKWSIEMLMTEGKKVQLGGK